MRWRSIISKPFNTWPRSITPNAPRESAMMTVDEALQHTGTIVEALQQVLAQAMAHARTVTQAVQAIDEHQVHCERLAYRATELRAMHDLLHYATDVQQHAPHE